MSDAVCPECWSSDLETTTKGQLGPQTYDYANKAKCHGCGLETVAAVFQLAAKTLAPPGTHEPAYTLPSTPITGGEPDCGNDWCDDPRTGPCAACAEEERVQSTIEDDAAPSGELMR